MSLTARANLAVFTRDDGFELQIVPGFRARVLGYRPAVTPKQGWTDNDYAAAAMKKRRRFERLLAATARWRPDITGSDVLDVGCGDGVNCLLMAMQPVRQVVGIDLHLPLLDPSAKYEPARRLADSILRNAGVVGGPGGAGARDALHRLPVRLEVMDARRMSLPDASFDLLISRSAMEHLMPIGDALDEMARVVRPGGLIHHSIDPYFWLRGCHKRGVVDIPWAHARLTDREYRRFVNEYEGPDRGAERCRRLETLNRLTLRNWRNAVEDSGPFEVLEWELEPSEFAQTVLGEYPEIEETVLPGVDRHDLVCGRINAWLRRT